MRSFFCFGTTEMGVVEIGPAIAARPSSFVARFNQYPRPGCGRSCVDYRIIETIN